jgi:hypothetical protein
MLIKGPLIRVIRNTGKIDVNFDPGAGRLHFATEDVGNSERGFEIRGKLFLALAQQNDL